jgi:hypothetical protein
MYKAFYYVHEENGHIKGSEGLDIDLEKGNLRTGNQMIGLTQLVERTEKGLQTRHYKRDRGSQFEMLVPSKFGAIMDSQISESVFNKLFLRCTFNPKYFRPVATSSPSYQLWEVVGDKGQ